MLLHMTITVWDARVAVFAAAAGLEVFVIRQIAHLWPSVFPRRRSARNINGD